jgi:hypothetical protein
VAALERDEYVTIRSFLLRAPTLAPAVRDPLARQLATPLRGRLRTTPPPGVPAEVFLVCVAAAHQRRHRPATLPGPGAFTSVWADPEPAPFAGAVVAGGRPGAGPGPGSSPTADPSGFTAPG